MEHDLEFLLGSDIIERLKSTEQNPKWHPEGNVFNHTLLVMKNVKERGLSDEFYVSAAFHDVGKIDSTFRKGDHLVAYGHELHASKYITERETFILSKFPDIDLDKVKDICSQHMRTHLYNNGKMSNISKREAFENLPIFQDLLVFAQCDAEGKEI